MDGKSVLIVDDSQGARAELSGEYSRLGFKIAGECSNGIEAIEFLEENPGVDLVSLDVIMPEMDGIECYRKIRSMGLDVRVLIVSALSNEARFTHAFENEIKQSHFISKDEVEQNLEASIAVVMSDLPLPLPKPEIEAAEQK